MFCIIMNDISELAENETLNREAARLSGLSDGETFTMANFTYANSVVVSQMFEHMENTMFRGISVSEYTNKSLKYISILIHLYLSHKNLVIKYDRL